MLLTTIPTHPPLVKVSANDTTPGYLNGKLTASTGISLTEGSDGGNETLSIAVVPGAVDHNSLLNLTVGDPHTQYLAKTAFTAGSVLFRGAGEIAQDNTKLFWDDANDFLGVNTATPRRRGDFLDAENAQIRATHTDNSVYAEFQTLNTGELRIATTATGGKTVLSQSLTNATGNEAAFTLNYTTNKATSGNDTGLLINQTDTASPGTSLLIDVQVGGNSKFAVTNAGVVTTAGNITSGTVTISNFKISTSNTGQPFLVNPISTALANTYRVGLGEAVLSQTSGNNGVVKINPTYNQVASTAANTDLLINRTETAIGSGAQYLLDLQVGGVSKCHVTNTGIMAMLRGQALKMQQALGTDADGDWQAYADGSGFYIQKRISGAWTTLLTVV